MEVRGDDWRIHLTTSLRCNNRCAFCMEGDHRAGDVPRGRAQFLDAAELERQLSRCPDTSLPLLFTSGEPTLNADLAALAGRARERGFGKIGLQTNGRMLCYEGYALRLIRAGIREFSVSVHGHDRLVHEAATRTPGSFDQTSRGLENLLRLKARLPFLRIVTTTTITRINVGRLTPLLRWLLGHAGLDAAVLNPMMLDGNALRHRRQLAVSYGETVRRLAESLRLLASEGARGLDRVCLIDVPPCVRGGLEAVAGPFERIILGDPQGRQERLRPEQSLETRKRPECAGCRRGRDCVGVSPRYGEAFGWSEFVPVR